MADREMDQDYLTFRTTETHAGPSSRIRSISGESFPAVPPLDIAASAEC